MSDEIRHVQIRVREELAVWFEENFSVASKQAFFEQCLEYLKIGVETGALPVPNIYPAFAATQAASSLIKKGQR